MNDLIFTLCLGAAAFVCAVALYVEIRSKLHSIQAEQKMLNDRVRKLEEANPKRINLTSLEEMEHAMAELVVLRMDAELKVERIDNVMGHLTKAHTPNNGKQK